MPVNLFSLTGRLSHLSSSGSTPRLFSVHGVLDHDSNMPRPAIVRVTVMVFLRHGDSESAPLFVRFNRLFLLNFYSTTSDSPATRPIFDPCCCQDDLTGGIVLQYHADNLNLNSDSEGEGSGPGLGRGLI